MTCYNVNVRMNQTFINEYIYVDAKAFWYGTDGRYILINYLHLSHMHPKGPHRSVSHVPLRGYVV